MTETPTIVFPTPPDGVNGTRPHEAVKPEASAAFSEHDLTVSFHPDTGYVYRDPTGKEVRKENAFRDGIDSEKRINPTDHNAQKEASAEVVSPNTPVVESSHGALAAVRGIINSFLHRNK
jgi:hypothetical protein